MGAFFYSTWVTCPNCLVCVRIVKKMANPVKVVATPITEILQCYWSATRRAEVAECLHFYLLLFVDKFFKFITYIDNQV